MVTCANLWFVLPAQRILHVCGRVSVRWLGGQWQGSGKLLHVPGCPPFGVCCLKDATCQEVLEADCLDLGGSFRGDQTQCPNIDCSQEFNDECFDAISVSNGKWLSTDGATTSGDAYNDAQCSGTYLGEMFADVWFSYSGVRAPSV